MPFPIFEGIEVFSTECIRQKGFAVSFSEVFLMQGFYILKLLFESRDEGIREDGDAVIVAFASTDLGAQGIANLFHEFPALL